MRERETLSFQFYGMYLTSVFYTLCRVICVSFLMAIRVKCFKYLLVFFFFFFINVERSWGRKEKKMNETRNNKKGDTFVKTITIQWYDRFIWNPMYRIKYNGKELFFCAALSLLSIKTKTQTQISYTNKIIYLKMYAKVCVCVCVCNTSIQI